MERKEYYRDTKVGDTFIVVRNGEKCTKTENDAIYLKNGMPALLFTTSEVKRIVE